MQEIRNYTIEKSDCTPYLRKVHKSDRGNINSFNKK